MMALFLAVALISSPRVRAADAAPGSDATQVDEGRRIYAQHCSHCHGFNMVNAGTVIPDLRRFAGDKALFFTTVKNGRNNRMPPWGDILSDHQIEGLWAYISSQRKP